MIGTVLNEADSLDFKTLFQLWKPLISIVAVSSSIPAKTRRLWVTSFSGTLRSGLNATLYSPGFMLPTVSDAEDQVVKWLSVNVGEYLDQGSPITDYTAQDGSCFIRTNQGDIDI